MERSDRIYERLREGQPRSASPPKADDPEPRFIGAKDLNNHIAIYFFAGMVEWQTRKHEGLVAQAVGVQVPFPAPWPHRLVA